MDRTCAGVTRRQFSGLRHYHLWQPSIESTNGIEPLLNTFAVYPLYQH